MKKAFRYTAVQNAKNAFRYTTVQNPKKAYRYTAYKNQKGVNVTRDYKNQNSLHEGLGPMINPAGPAQICVKCHIRVVGECVRRPSSLQASFLAGWGCEIP